MDPDRPRYFCDIEMSYTDYDHYRANCAYVRKFYRHLMTPLERRVTEYNYPVTSDPEGDLVKMYSTSITMTEVLIQTFRRTHEFLEKRDGHVDDAEVLRAFQKSPEEREAAAADRLMTECIDQIQINCCPKCSCVLRTPLARQCLWCGHDWH